MKPIVSDSGSGSEKYCKDQLQKSRQEGARLLEFCRLFQKLDETTSTRRKVEALKDYFSRASTADAVWALHYLAGKKRKRLVSSTALRGWVQQHLDLPEWLLEEAYSTVGDSAEYLTHIWQSDYVCEAESTAVAPTSDAPMTACTSDHDSLPSLAELSQELQGRLSTTLSEDDRFRAVCSYWQRLPDAADRFVFNKILTGAFRVGVSEKTVVQALSELYAIEASTLTHRLMGRWQPTPKFYLQLIDPLAAAEDVSRPYPFMLAHPWQQPIEVFGAKIEALGPKIEDLEERERLGDWVAEWKWDGMRGQVIKRAGQVFVWSRGEELLQDSFPDLVRKAHPLPDGTVLDGEILVGEPVPGGVGCFSDLQKRLGRKRPSQKFMSSYPACFVAFDVLELEGVDLRSQGWQQRRAKLEQLELPEGFGLQTVMRPKSFEELNELRAQSEGLRAEGLMLKSKDAPYGVGRVRGHWWKWKREPRHVDTVLLYAQAGHGVRANQFTDYTLGVWRDSELVPVAKAYSGLDRTEIAELDRWIKRHTLERFGPVRKVPAEQVLEIAFEAVHVSNRHKSGLALRFPRVVRWRKDKRPEQADQLKSLQQWIEKPEL